MQSTRKTSLVGALMAAGLAIGAAGCGGATAPVKPARAVEPIDLGDADLWLSFERAALDFDGAQEFPDALDGAHAGRVVVARGGRVELVEGPDGPSGSAHAVAFPSVCSQAKKCPGAMIEVQADPALDPGGAAFEFGVTVLLAPDETSAGSNLIQKGRFGSEGGQYKLQVDGADGRPSCVIRDADQIVTVRSETGVADAQWHRIVCRREAATVSIYVDGIETTKQAQTGDVSSPWPLRIGAPGLSVSDDQFHGHLDDVYLRIDDES